MLAATLDTVPEHQWATVLLWHIAILTDPAPVDDETAHPDPADADRYPPADLHDPAGTAPRTTDRITRAGDENLDPAGDLDAPPDADEWLPPDPADADDAAGDDANPASTRARVLAALAAAAAFYAAAGARGPGCLPTSTGRGLPATAAGYAPATWTALVDHLRAAGYTDQEILAAGLARHSSRGGLIDFFHDRAVLPITRPQDGAVVAFIGRKHPDDTNDRAPKYLNSPTTTVFRKSDLPFGLTPQQVDRAAGGCGPGDRRRADGRPRRQRRAPGPGRRRAARHRPHRRAPGHPERIAPLADRRVLLAPGQRRRRPSSLRQGVADPGRRRRHRRRHHHPRRREGPGGTARHPRPGRLSPTPSTEAVSTGRPRRRRDLPPVDRRQRLRRTPASTPSARPPH